jgi:hypothetical protein
VSEQGASVKDAGFFSTLFGWFYIARRMVAGIYIVFACF